MQDREVEVVVLLEMCDRGNEGALERTVIRPPGEELVDDRVMKLSMPLGILYDGQLLPLHTRVEHRQNVVEDPLITDLAVWSAIGRATSAAR